MRSSWPLWRGLPLVCLAAMACSHHRATAHELLTALSNTGLHAQQVAELEPRAEWVGGELGVDLMLDYEQPYLAVRFTSADLARAYCQGGQGGVTYGVWCLEPKVPQFRQDTWNKVNELRTR